MPRSSILTVGSDSFQPDAFFEKWSATAAPSKNDLRRAIIEAFGLKHNDDYLYHAMASVTLEDVQAAIDAGGQGGLHAWYLEKTGTPIPPPPAEDIAAYTNVFSSTTATPKALTALAANAKKNSLRAQVAAYLQAQLLLPSSRNKLTLQKLKKPHTNPYFDFWAWSCANLEWAGPVADTESVKQSHHILPVFYHHFGCVCPSFDALALIQQLAHPKYADRGSGSDGGTQPSRKSSRRVIDVGSGNGYWTYLLRRLGLTVCAVDSGASVWRTMWIEDTIVEDAVVYLPRESGALDAILLLVYPQVGADFTSRVLTAYRGDTVVVAGTQNTNGFTGFKDQRVDHWFAKNKQGWRKTVQLPLPSFAGKDDALFIFERST